MNEPEVAHKASAPAINELLDLFSVPPTDTTFTKGRYTVHNPVQVGINPIEFIIRSNTEYIDLAQSYFTIEGKFTKDDDNPVLAATHLYPATNLFHTMIKQPSLWLNGTLVTDQTDTYPYLAYLETLLNYGNNASETILKPSGWYKATDYPYPLTANKMDNVTPHDDYMALSTSAKEAVKGAKAAKARLLTTGTASKTFILTGQPHIDVFHLDRLLVPNVEIKIRFDLNQPDFYLNGVGANGKLVENEFKMRFHVKSMEVRSDLKVDLLKERLTKRTLVIYPLLKSELRVFTMTGGQREWDEDEVFQGRIPQRVVVVMVHGNAYIGDVTRNPFYFEKFGLQTPKMLVNGEEYPSEPIVLVHNNETRDILGYDQLIRQSGALLGAREMMISSEDWSHGSTILMWNNIPDTLSADATHLNPKKSGNLRFKFTFGAAPGHIVNILVYGEFQTTLEIDPNGAVIYDK